MGRASAWAAGDDRLRAELAAAAERARQAGLSPDEARQVERYWEKARKRAVIATAVSYRIGDAVSGRMVRPREGGGWQKEAWEFYDSCGELHYVAAQCGRGVASARLYIARYDEQGVPREVETGDAAAMTRDLLGGDAYRAELMHALGVQGIIAGESLITVHDDDGWQVWSDQDFEVDTSGARSGSPYKVNQGSTRMERLPDKTLTIHMWDRHPGRAWGVDSSTRAALPYLRELARLDQYVQSTLLSRIALAGILVVPEEADLAPPANLPEMPQDADPLMHTLAYVGEQNISNPGQAGGVLPVIIRLPDGKQLEHMTLDMPLTSEINEFRELNLKRVAYSMDMSPETMTGFAGVKYSNAEMIRDESVRSHIASRVAAIAAALTRGYVRPALGDDYFVQWDLSELETETDRTEAAIALYDRGELDGDTLREFTGLRSGSAPEGQDLLRQLATNAALKNPELLPQLAPILGVQQINIPRVEVERPAEIEQAPQDTPREDPLEDRPATTPAGPETEPEPEPQPEQPGPAHEPVVSEALVASCDMLVCAALGKAGQVWRKKKTARTSMCRRNGVTARAVYLQYPVCEDRPEHMTAREYAVSLIEGRMEGVDRIAALYGADEHCLQATLVNFVSELIAERKPYEPPMLAEAIAGCVTDAA